MEISLLPAAKRTGKTHQEAYMREEAYKHTDSRCAHHAEDQTDRKPLQPRFTCTGHSRGVLCVAVSDDGKFIASGSLDGTVRVWDGKTGRGLHELTEHTQRVRGIAVFRPADNKSNHVVVSCSYDGTVRLWDAETGVAYGVAEPVAEAGDVVLNLVNQTCVSLAVSPDRTSLLAGYSGYLVRWALDPDGKGATVDFHGAVQYDWVYSVAVQGKLIVASVGDTVYVTDAKEPKQYYWNGGLSGHVNTVRGVALCGDNTVVSVSLDNTWRLWDVHNGQLKATHEGPPDNPNGFRSVAVGATLWCWGPATARSSCARCRPATCCGRSTVCVPMRWQSVASTLYVGYVTAQSKCGRCVLVSARSLLKTRPCD